MLDCRAATLDTVSPLARQPPSDNHAVAAVPDSHLDCRATSGLGAAPDAFIWGWLGDRIRRRTVLIWSAVMISLATGIMVFTPGPSAVIPGWLFLVFFRVFVGIGNAGIFTIDLPLVQEFIPAYKRGWVSALVTTHCYRVAACWPAWWPLGCCRSSAGATCSWWACRRSCWCS
jgi:MFS family permease